MTSIHVVYWFKLKFVYFKAMQIAITSFFTQIIRQMWLNAGQKWKCWMNTGKTRFFWGRSEFLQWQKELLLENSKQRKLSIRLVWVIFSSIPYYITYAWTYEDQAAAPLLSVAVLLFFLLRCVSERKKNSNNYWHNFLTSPTKSS